MYPLVNRGDILVYTYIDSRGVMVLVAVRGRDREGRRVTHSEALEREIEAQPEIYAEGRMSGEWQPGEVETLRREIERLRAAKEEAVSAQQRLAFLCDASRELASSLDREATLETITRVTVPVMADICFVLVESGPEGRLDIGASRAQPSQEQLLQQLLRTYLATPMVEPAARGEGALENPIVTVMKTGAPVLMTNVPDGYLRGAADGERA
jgi:hypothetical protein